MLLPKWRIGCVHEMCLHLPDFDEKLRSRSRFEHNPRKRELCGGAHCWKSNDLPKVAYNSKIRSLWLKQTIRAFYTQKVDIAACGLNVFLINLAQSYRRPPPVARSYIHAVRKTASPQRCCLGASRKKCDSTPANRGQADGKENNINAS